MAMSELEWMDIFAGNLRDIMEEQNMSQREVADALGVTESTVSKYLHARIMPSPRVLCNMVHEFDLDVYDVLYFGDKIE